MPATWDYQLSVGIDMENSGYAGAILRALSLFRKISHRVAQQLRRRRVQFIPVI
jgi:hypothetical protein